MQDADGVCKVGWVNVGGCNAQVFLCVLIKLGILVLYILVVDKEACAYTHLSIDQDIWSNA